MQLVYNTVLLRKIYAIKYLETTFFDEKSNDKNDDDDSLCDWQAIVYCWWQCRQDSDWNWDRAEHRRWQIVLSHLVLFLLLILFHMLLLLQGKVCRRSASMRNSRYVMWTHNFLTHNPSFYQPPCFAKDKSFFTPETSTRFYFQKKDTLNLKALMNHTWSDCFQEVRKKKTFCPLVWGLRIKS